MNALHQNLPELMLAFGNSAVSLHKLAQVKLWFAELTCVAEPRSHAPAIAPSSLAVPMPYFEIGSWEPAGS
eukprot:1148414-Pelagomonas_calceolata.AAC.1